MKNPYDFSLSSRSFSSIRRIFSTKKLSSSFSEFSRGGGEEGEGELVVDSLLGGVYYSGCVMFNSRRASCLAF